MKTVNDIKIIYLPLLNKMSFEWFKITKTYEFINIVYFNSLFISKCNDSLHLFLLKYSDEFNGLKVYNLDEIDKLAEDCAFPKKWILDALDFSLQHTQLHEIFKSTYK